MRSENLGSVLRSVLFASLASGSLLSAAGCGAAVGPVDAGGDSGTDTVTRADHVEPVDSVTPEDVQTPADTVEPGDARTCPAMVTGGPSGCDAVVTWACNPPPGIVAGQHIEGRVCAANCPPGMFGGSEAFACWAQAGPNGETVVTCTYCAVGRRTEGMIEPDLLAPGNVVGQFLANNATLEAASVTAFERLHRELRAHGAPDALLELLATAAVEERDHAERVTRAARAWGVEPQAAMIADVAPRSLFAIAVENAVEGCVRETYGAVVAAWQSWRASDPELAALYEHLADDETRHASISWRMDEWIAPLLTAAERTEVARARRAAVQGLYAELESTPHPMLVRVAGMPDAAAARAMIDGLTQDLWRDARPS